MEAYGEGLAKQTERAKAPAARSNLVGSLMECMRLWRTRDQNRGSVADNICQDLTALPLDGQAPGELAGSDG